MCTVLNPEVTRKVTQHITERVGWAYTRMGAGNGTSVQNACLLYFECSAIIYWKPVQNFHHWCNAADAGLL